MKKRLTHAFGIFEKIVRYSALVFIGSAPMMISAQETFDNPIQARSLNEFLVQVLDVVILIGAIAVVFFIILAGFKYVTARGDEKQISSAHQTLTWTIVGGAIVLGARVIASTIDSTVRQLGV